MAKSAKFAPVSTPRGWMVSIPPKFTASGKRERMFFPLKKKAEAKADELRKRAATYGQQAAAIKPGLAEDATKAAALLAGHNMTLHDVVRAWLDAKDASEASPTMDEAWEAALDIRVNHRPRTKSDYRAWRKDLPGWFLAMRTQDITQDDIRRALSETTTGPTRWKNGLRYISAVLGDLVKTRKLTDNIAKGIQTPRDASEEDDVVIYAPDEMKALFAACKKYTKGKDQNCEPCKVPFAFMAFAGIRPDELTKLRWDNVSLELRNIRIGKSIAKRKRRRNIRISDTLAAWIETIPEDERMGKIVPSRWQYRAARVRREAGICGREKQDALRHSFGTYTLAVEGDLAALKTDMGHAHMAVFFDHYHKATTKREALPYFQILPEGREIQLEVVA
jgi:integrase